MTAVAGRGSRWLRGALLALVTTATGVACGSDSQRKQGRDGDAGATTVGQAGADATMSGGSSVLPQGGATGEAAGGAGGLKEAGGAGGLKETGGRGDEQPDLGGASPAGAGGTAGLAGVPSEGGNAGAGGAGRQLPALPPVDCTSIVFKDADLDSAVRAALGKPTGAITPDDVVELTSLEASDRDISDLSGIECLTALELLQVSGSEIRNPISDLGPLSYLTNLNWLDLSHDPVLDLDLSPLRYLDNLGILYLDYVTLGDMTPLAELPGLRALSLTYSTLDDPQSFAKIPDLEQLLAVGCVDDAALITKMTHLVHLELGNTTLANPSQLATLVNLVYLDAFDMGLTNATPFASMPQLSYLNLNYNAITTLDGVEGLANLTEIYLNSNPITSLQPLVDNAALGVNNVVSLTNAQVDCQTEATKIAALIARSVAVVGNPCP
jgi:Leucine rich repeat